MTSESSYKIARTLEEAVAALEAGSDSQFDPELVRSFLKLIEQGVITA